MTMPTGLTSTIWTEAVETALAELRRRGFTEDQVQRFFRAKNGRWLPGAKRLLLLFPPPPRPTRKRGPRRSRQ